MLKPYHAAPGEAPEYLRAIGYPSECIVSMALKYGDVFKCGRFVNDAVVPTAATNGVRFNSSA